MVDQSEIDTSWTFVDSDEGLKDAAAMLSAGHGPIGVDAERASGYKYFANAYLVQASRRGSGTFIFDPTLLTSFDPLAEAMSGEEWIFHAASQDLPSLADLNLVPECVFDTELAARLLGLERVGLGAVVEEHLGVSLEKAYSAADWSTRPLPPEWLEYAALDVSLLPELRDRLYERLDAADKVDIAQQEFDAVLRRPIKPKPEDPWRKLSGSHQLRTRAQWAVARELWLERDALARSIDVAPGRLLPDSSIVLAAVTFPRSADELARNKQFRGRASRSELSRWWRAIRRGKSATSLPDLRPPASETSIPHHRTWSRKNPAAAARLKSVRELLAGESERLSIPLENLLAPDVLRSIAWDPPVRLDAQSIAHRLEELGARPWQSEATKHIITDAFVENA